MPKRYFPNSYILSLFMVYWINFQIIYTFTYQKTFLHTENDWTEIQNNISSFQERFLSLEHIIWKVSQMKQNDKMKWQNNIPTIKLLMDHNTRIYWFYYSKLWYIAGLTLSWRRLLWYRKQSIDLLCKSMDWFLYDHGLRHDRVKGFTEYFQAITRSSHQRCFVKKVFLQISQYSQENTCVRVSFW